MATYPAPPSNTSATAIGQIIADRKDEAASEFKDAVFTKGGNSVRRRWEHGIPIDGIFNRQGRLMQEFVTGQNRRDKRRNEAKLLKLRKAAKRQ